MQKVAFKDININLCPNLNPWQKEATVTTDEKSVVGFFSRRAIQ